MTHSDNGDGDSEYCYWEEDASGANIDAHGVDCLNDDEKQIVVTVILMVTIKIMRMIFCIMLMMILMVVMIIAMIMTISIFVVADGV